MTDRAATSPPNFMPDVRRKAGRLACADTRTDPRHVRLGSVVPDDFRPDRPPAHKAEGVRKAIENAGCELLYLLRYSPDFNPIENALSKLKALLPAKAECSVDALWSSVGEIVKLFEPQECAKYFAAAGMTPIKTDVL